MRRAAPVALLLALLAVFAAAGCRPGGSDAAVQPDTAAHSDTAAHPDAAVHPDTAPDAATGAAAPRPRISAEHPVTSPPALAAGVWDPGESPVSGPAADSG